MELAILGVLLLVGIVVVALYAKQLPTLFPRDAVRERIRHEVHQEFDESIQRSTGFRRWWLIRKREREISRRLARIIYGNPAA